MKKFWVFAVVLSFAVYAQATIRYVSTVGAGAYTTLNAAGAAAVSGDTILVGPGTYSTTTLNESTKRLTWIGAGWDQTIVNMGSFDIWYFNSAAQNRSSVEGMRISSNNNDLFRLNSNADSITIRRCYLAQVGTASLIGTAGGRGLTVEDCIFVITGAGGNCIDVSLAGYPSVVRNCVFANNSGSITPRAFFGGAASGTIEVYNSVFLNWKTVFSLSTAGGSLIAVNNMFYDWLASPTLGSYNAVSIFDYNASQTIAAPGTNALNIASDPFVNYDEAANYVLGTSDLHLDPTNGAAFINTGHPSLVDFLDATQSDFGIYGGPKPNVDNGVPNYPWAVNISTTPNLVGVGTPVNAVATGRVGPSY